MPIYQCSHRTFIEGIFTEGIFIEGIFIEGIFTEFFIFDILFDKELTNVLFLKDILIYNNNI